MDTRTLGVKEELLAVDPTTRSVTARAPEVLREYAHHQGAARRTTDRLGRGCRGRRRRPHCGRVDLHTGVLRT